MSDYVPIDDFFKANDEALERKYGPADKGAVVEKLFESVKARTCKTPGCNNEVRRNKEFCEDCGARRRRETVLKRRRKAKRKRAEQGVGE